MRAVRRGPEPQLLTSLTLVHPDRTWDSSGEPEVHAAIVGGLRHQQGNVCAYCERILVLGGRVEHVHPKSIQHCDVRPSSNHNYDWLNLLLVCVSSTHCDGPKSDKHLCEAVVFPDELLRDLAYIAVNSLTGEVAPAVGLEPAVRGRLENAIAELNLNDPELAELRLATISMIRNELAESGRVDLARHRASVSGGFPSTIEAYLKP